MLKLITKEAQAYLRLGLLSPSRHRIRQVCSGRARTGVMFVPGVGANGSQFLALKRHLEPYAERFDSFEYFSLRHPTQVAADLESHLEQVQEQADWWVLIGHSLGGLLSSMVLQGRRVPDNILGFVSICAPLHGTWRSRLGVSPGLRALTPDGPMITSLLRSRHRLARLGGRVLTIGALKDQMITPHSSAIIESLPSILLEDVAHAGALLDRDVHDAIVEAVRTWRRSAENVAK